MIKNIAIVVLIGVLAACGGGGGNSSLGPAVPPQNLDSGFGSGGILRTGFGLGPGLMTRLPTGEFEVTGSSWIGSELQHVISRYTADGHLDTGFGSGGRVRLESVSPLFGATGMLHRQDGTIILIGMSLNGNKYDLHIMKFFADGRLDSAFGDAGRLISIFGEFEGIAGIAAQPDGKIIAVGAADNGHGSDFLVVRFNADGSLDDTFGTHGAVTTAFSGFAASIYAGAEFVVVQPDGKILVNGSVRLAHQFSDESRTALLRYNSDGTLDQGFGVDGRLENVSGPSLPVDLLLLADGTIYTSGGDAVSKVSASGTPEVGVGGVNLGGFAVDSQGRVVLAMTEADTNGYHIAIVRFLPDGSADTAFGTGGKLITKLSEYDYPRTVLIQDNDQILLEASTRDSAGVDSAIVLKYAQ